jgi:hypothetical protein
MINRTLPDDVLDLQTKTARVISWVYGTRYAEVYILRVNQGMTFKQIGEVMGIPLSTAHFMYTRVETLIEEGGDV